MFTICFIMWEFYEVLELVCKVLCIYIDSKKDVYKRQICRKVTVYFAMFVFLI